LATVTGLLNLYCTHIGGKARGKETARKNKAKVGA
jgi:hypothetical protein